MTRGMRSVRADSAAWEALDALYAEGYHYRATVAPDRATLGLKRGHTTACTAGATLGDALATAALILGLCDHPAIRAAAPTLPPPACSEEVPS